jgi:hypothetical protein
MIHITSATFLLIALSIAVEAVTEIITSSKLFDGPRTAWKRWTYPIDGPPSRNTLQHIKVFIDDLWSCGYCTSVWIAALAAFFAPTLVAQPIANWVINTFVLHRLSNALHATYELVRRGRVRTYDLMVRGDTDFDELLGEKNNGSA